MLNINILDSYEAIEGMTGTIYSGKIIGTFHDDGINASGVIRKQKHMEIIHLEIVQEEIIQKEMGQGMMIHLMAKEDQEKIIHMLVLPLMIVI